MTDGRIEQCTCGNSGAAVLIGSAGTAVLTRTTITGNTAGTNAAVTAILGGSASVTDCLVDLNTNVNLAEVFGVEYGMAISSGLLATASGALYVEGTTVSNNHNYGTAAAAAAWVGHLEVTNSIFKDNYAVAHTGCLSFVFSSGRVHNVEFDGCETPGFGGALLLYNAVVEATDLDIKNSKAGEGAGIWITGPGPKYARQGSNQDQLLPSFPCACSAVR